MAGDTVAIDIEAAAYSTSPSLNSNSSNSDSLTEFQSARAYGATLAPDDPDPTPAADLSSQARDQDRDPELELELVRADQPDAGTMRRGRGTRLVQNVNSYAANKNVAEGMMDIALLSANANQLRFLITYNSNASTYYISLGLIVLSLVMQVSVGIALIFKHRMKRCNGKRFTRTNEFLVGGVFMVTVVNILLAAFTTTDGRK